MIRLLELVTGNVIQRFLDSKGVGDSCPMCQRGELSIAVYDPLEVEAHMAPAIRVIHVMDDGSRQGFGEFMRVCANCGYIHYIRDAEVLAFLDEEVDNG